MIKLTSAAQARRLAGKLPAIAVERMVQFEGYDGCYDPEEHGYILVLEEGDQIESEVPMLGESELLAVLDDGESLFEYVFFVRENGRRVFEATVPLAGEAMLVLIVPEEPWVDERLLRALIQMGQEDNLTPPSMT